MELEFLHSIIEHNEVLEVNGWAPKFEPLPPNEDKVLPYEERPPKLELKPLPSHLKTHKVKVVWEYPDQVRVLLNTVRLSLLSEVER